MVVMQAPLRGGFGEMDINCYANAVLEGRTLGINALAREAHHVIYFLLNQVPVCVY